MSILELLSKEQRKEYEEQAIKSGKAFKELAKRLRDIKNNNFDQRNITSHKTDISLEENGEYTSRNN